MKTISEKEVEQVARQLTQLGFNFLALHKLSRLDWYGDYAHLVILTETVCKAAVREIDSCLGRLGATRLGNFDADEEESADG